MLSIYAPLLLRIKSNNWCKKERKRVEKGKKFLYPILKNHQFKRMEGYRNMKLEDITLQYLEDDKEAMKNLISAFFNAVMKEEVNMQVGADEYERSDSRRAHRNDYRTRSLKTRYGKVELKKPQIREFPFETLVFDRYSRVERATRNAIAESYV